MFWMNYILTALLQLVYNIKICACNACNKYSYVFFAIFPSLRHPCEFLDVFNK